MMSDPRSSMENFFNPFRNHSRNVSSKIWQGHHPLTKCRLVVVTVSSCMLYSLSAYVSVSKRAWHLSPASPPSIMFVVKRIHYAWYPWTNYAQSSSTARPNAGSLYPSIVSLFSRHEHQKKNINESFPVRSCTIFGLCAERCSQLHMGTLLLLLEETTQQKTNAKRKILDSEYHD